MIQNIVCLYVLALGKILEVTLDPVTRRKQSWDDLGKEHSRDGNKGHEVQKKKVVVVGRYMCSLKFPGWGSPSPPNSPSL